MKTATITLLLLTGLAMAAGYNNWQQGAIEGLKIGFQMGEMYNQAQQGINVSGFNAQVDRYNAWVQKNFGNDQNLLMPYMQEKGVGSNRWSYVPEGPVLNPIRITNVSRGIVHEIDGNPSPRTDYPQPDANGRIHGWPADAYYTWFPDALGTGNIQSNNYVNSALGAV